MMQCNMPIFDFVMLGGGGYLLQAYYRFKWKSVYRFISLKSEIRLPNDLLSRAYEWIVKTFYSNDKIDNRKKKLITRPPMI